MIKLEDRKFEAEGNTNDILTEFGLLTLAMYRVLREELGEESAKTLIRANVEFAFMSPEERSAEIEKLTKKHEFYIQEAPQEERKVNK